MMPQTKEKSGEDIHEEEEIVVGEGDEDAAVDAGGAAPTHLPFAPSPEFSCTSSTVDPSYIISLIRKLLPHCTRTDGCYKSIQTTGVEEAEVSAREECIRDLPVSTLRDDMTSKIKQLGKTGESDGIAEQSELSVIENVWEDCACILWDLAANRDHAKFMVDNFLLDVLSMNVTISKSPRVTEICLGIIGNLACHDALSNAIVSTSGLVETIVDQLTLNDTACLCEMCRLLTVSLQHEGFLPWVEALCPEYILQRILWIAENTLNSQLFEKVMQLLLAIISREEIANILLPSLMKLGLPDLLVGLLSCEMSKQTDMYKLERVSVLDLILQVIEALSTTDNYSSQISSNDQLFLLLSGIVKLPHKDEVGSCCETAVVTVANILMDEPQLASKLSKDISFLQGLLDTFPFVSGDPQARTAVWSILARLLLHIQESDMSKTCLQRYIQIILEKAYLIEDDLESHVSHDCREDPKMISLSGEMINATTISLRRIAGILNQWRTKQAVLEEADTSIDDRRVQLLLDYCCKHSDV